MCVTHGTGEQFIRLKAMPFRYHQKKKLKIINRFETEINMMPKTEQNVIGNVPVSRPALSFESIVKDLQDLSKSVATKNDVALLEAKIKKIGKENQKLKADVLAKETELAATEKKRKLYYNLFHENVKVVAELKAENEFLKAEIEASKSNTEENRVEEISSSSSTSIQSAVPVNDTDSDIEENQPHNPQPQLAICNGNDDTEQNKSRSTGPANKKRQVDDDATLIVKKSRKRKASTIIDSWKCIVCKTARFQSIADVRSHMRTFHPERKFYCKICPYTCTKDSEYQKHKKVHGHTTDSNYKCSLCNIAFGAARSLTQHQNYYH